MDIDSPHDLFVSSLQHVYYTEQRLIEALEQFEETTTHTDLEDGLADHRAETEGHVERLETVFDILDTEPEAAEDPIIEGMMDSYEELLEKDPGEAAINRYTLVAGHKAEHYEIAAYGNLVSMASAFGHDEVADLLEETLREEQAELETLSALTDSFDETELAQAA